MKRRPCIVCATTTATLYPGGWLCADHTPAKAMGLPEPRTWVEQQQLQQGRALREEGVARVEQASDDWDRAVVDRAIREVAAKGRPFSANDVRPLLPPGIRKNLVGARFLAASRSGLIRKIGYTPSTDPKTHAHPVATWEAA
jgi:hypothetical protein